MLFAHPDFGGQLVFKGGTSLSKVALWQNSWVKMAILAGPVRDPQNAASAIGEYRKPPAGISRHRQCGQAPPFQENHEHVESKNKEH